jgi:hypothetical protein
MAFFTPEVIAAFLTGVAGPITLHLVQNWRNDSKGKNNDVVLQHLNIQVCNQEIVDEIRNQLNASRVSIFKFSNGTDFLDNTHMLNISLTNESLDNGIHSIKKDWQRVPAYIIDASLNQLKLKDSYIQHNSDMNPNNPEEARIINLRISSQTKSVLVVKLVDKKGKWYGLLSIDYENYTDIDGSHAEWVKVKSKQIQ